VAEGTGKLEIDTYGELKTLIRAITMKQKGLKIKGVIIDTIVDELIGKLPGGPTAKKTLDFVKAAFSKPDSTKTNTWLDKLDIDDQFSAIVDDTIENNFLQDISKRIEGQSDETPLRQDFNMNTELEEFLKQNYKGRTVTGTQHEVKKMKKSDITSILREIVTEDQDKLRAGHLGTLRGSLLHLKTLVKAEKPYEQILDYIDRVIEQTKSSDPLSEEANNIFNKAELIDYLENLESSTRVSIPKIEGKGFSPSVGQQFLAGEALDTLEKTHLDGEFKLYMDNPTFKRFSLVQSPESTKSHEKLVQSFGTED
jgi:hypothetical protein